MSNANFLVSVATGGPRIAEVDQQCRERRRRLSRRLGRLGLKDPFPWADLWQWHGYWSEALPGWASRRVHINELATPLLAELERRLEDEGWELEDWPACEQVPTTWHAIDGRLMEMKGRLDAASSLDDLQDVGRRCREILMGAGRLVFSEAMLTEGATVPSPNDSKARIGYYLDVRLSSGGHSDLRRLLRVAYDLMQTVTHSASITAIDAFAAAQATVLLVRTLQKIDAQSQAIGDLGR
jgi:hypothetical protein